MANIIPEDSISILKLTESPSCTLTEPIILTNGIQVIPEDIQVDIEQQYSSTATTLDEPKNNNKNDNHNGIISSGLDNTMTVRFKLDFEKKGDYWRFFKKRRYLPWWILLMVLILITVLMFYYHKQIVLWLTPISTKIRSLKWGPIIPIILLIILSFPPLLGHEIIEVLCGIVYGLWPAFGIVSTGIFLGEIIIFILFRTLLHHRALSYQQKNLNYASLARILRTKNNGFWMVFILRLSIIPSHFTTAVFASTGVEFWVYCLASLITLPKQIVIVYLGILIGDDGRLEGGKGVVVRDVLIGGTAVVTVISGGYIWFMIRRMRRVIREEVEQEIVRRCSVGGFDVEGGVRSLNLNLGRVGDVEDEEKRVENDRIEALRIVEREECQRMSMEEEIRKRQMELKSMHPN